MLQRRCGVSAVLLLIAANLLWAGQGVAVKLLAGTLSALTIALIPLYFITLTGFLLLCAHGDATQRFRAAWHFRFEFLLAGICGQLIAQVGMTLGISWSSASNGAVLSLLIPIFGVLMAVWLLREHVSFLRGSVLLLGLAGILLVSPLRHPTRFSPHLHEFAGNILIALGCLGSAFYNVFSKRLLAYFSSLEILFFSYLSTTLFSLPVLLLCEPRCLGSFTQLAPSQWAAFFYLAIFLYGVSMALFLKALRSVDVVIASASLYLTPLFGVAFAYSILKERLGVQAIVGAAIILLATFLLFRFDSPSPKWKSIGQV